jgi:hypothetical protein
VRRGNELLQRPAAREPAAAGDAGAGLVLLRDHFRGYIRQIGVAHIGVAVPAKHGVDGLGQLGAALLVDAASGLHVR